MAEAARALLGSLLLSGCVLDSTLGVIDTGDGTGGETSAADSRGDVGQTSQASLDGGPGDGGSGDGASDGGSELPPPSPDGWVVPEQCLEVASESAYCLTLAYDAAVLVGVDTGSTCVVRSGIQDVLVSPSFAWRGMSMVTCNSDGSSHRIGRIDLQTGHSELFDVECESVTAVGTQILVSTYYGGSVLVYDDDAALAADTPSQQLELTVEGSRMWTDGELVLHAWHSTDTIWRDTIGGEPLPDLILEDYDGWIWGMTIIDDTLLLLTPGDGPTHDLRKVDPQTGALLELVLTDDLFIPMGLRCRPGEGR